VKRQRVARDDAGFTMIELLVVVVIEAMIVTALGSAFVLVMNNSTTVKESLARTNDARFAASYIVSDARNSSGPETSLSDTASCPDPSPPVSGSATPVVRFSWNGTTSVGATTTNIVNYVLVSDALLRRYCRNGSLVSDDALATNVATATVACAPTANCSGTPTKITATITATQGASLGAAYQYSLTGAFRKALAVGFPLLSISGPASLAAWTVNRPYPSTTIVGAGGGGSYIWSASGLPAGMTINASTGVISGTPTAAGAPSATITLNDSLGDAPATQQYTVTINAAPSITTASPLPNGFTGFAYSTTIAGSGGTAPYAWSATSLPAGLTINASTGTISGTPTAAGTSTVAVTLTDAAGAAVVKNLSLTITASPTISSVTLANGGTIQGRIEKSDTISVVFSAQMSVSSFCSTWSGDAADQSLTANNDVTVNVADGTGATNDSLTVTSATCTFRFGSIDLGSNAYLSGGAATFAGSGGNKSTITWTAATRTLTITLGTKAGAGTVATVNSSTPVYTASGSIVGSNGVAISNSPFTLAAAKQF
jgi:prepilin-type N-terminal cleavage/methylation domain-containing protein